jgi:hypothetical protein
VFVAISPLNFEVSIYFLITLCIYDSTYCKLKNKAGSPGSGERFNFVRPGPHKTAVRLSVCASSTFTVLAVGGIPSTA